MFHVQFLKYIYIYIIYINILQKSKNEKYERIFELLLVIVASYKSLRDLFSVTEIPSLHGLITIMVVILYTRFIQKENNNNRI